MAASKRRLILEAYLTRLEAIQVVNGYNTNVGLNIFLNETIVLGPDDPDKVIAVVVRDDVAGYQGEHIMLSMPIAIQAIAKTESMRDRERPWLVVEDVLQDIKRAVELADRTLGGLIRHKFERGATRTMEREEGSPWVGAEMQYLNPYSEQWGRP